MNMQPAERQALSDHLKDSTQHYERETPIYRSFYAKLRALYATGAAVHCDRDPYDQDVVTFRVSGVRCWTIDSALYRAKQQAT